MFFSLFCFCWCFSRLRLHMRRWSAVSIQGKTCTSPDSKKGFLQTWCLMTFTWTNDKRGYLEHLVITEDTWVHVNMMNVDVDSHQSLLLTYSFFTLFLYNFIPKTSVSFSFIPPIRSASLPKWTPFRVLHPSFIIQARFDSLAWFSSDDNTTHRCALFSCLSSLPALWRTPPPPSTSTLTLLSQTPPPPSNWTPLSGAGPGCQALSCECGCCDFLWAIRWAAAN